MTEERSHTSAAAVEAQAAAACTHHWVIDLPNGPTSMGVCKRCGDSRAFGNAFEYPDLADDRSGHWPYRRRRNTADLGSMFDTGMG